MEKKLKDLTEEQVIEIAKLVYPFKSWIKSEFNAHYQPYDPTWLDDAQEYWLVKFEAITFGNRIDTYRLWIYPTLDLEFDAISTNPDNFTKVNNMKVIGEGKNAIVLLGRFPIRNQHLIQKKFIEWKIVPEIESFNDF